MRNARDSRNQNSKTAPRELKAHKNRIIPTMRCDKDLPRQVRIDDKQGAQNPKNILKALSWNQIDHMNFNV
jgi:hypothetical protein